MNYTEVTFITDPNTETVHDVLNSLLGDIGFESFAESPEGVKAYIQDPLYDQLAIESIINSFPFEANISYSTLFIEAKDWNEEWEKNYFKPIIIANRCVVHSTFHTDVPDAEYRIIIDPKMAFGTGHHETTGLIISELLDADLKNKSLLDMGCGTSILAILGSLKGANPITAIDIDSWCVDNSIDNIALNKIDNINVELGDASNLKNSPPFDVIIANINRNILLNDLQHYVLCMKAGSELYMSGFYVKDIPILKAEAAKHQLTFVHHRENNNWAVVKFRF